MWDVSQPRRATEGNSQEKGENSNSVLFDPGRRTTKPSGRGNHRDLTPLANQHRCQGSLQRLVRDPSGRWPAH
ncbi:hypothetical protein BH10PLA2_BH10PLA2_02920 [soil metagenome]